MSEVGSCASGVMRRSDLSARRIVLTHMSPDMLEREGRVACERAHEGLIISL